MTRKPAGTHVYYRNGYFTFTNNMSYPDIKCNVMAKWCTKEYIGETDKSKTVVPAHFGDSREAPTRAKLVLRAWMLYKVNSCNFVSQRPSRRKIFEDKTAALRAELVALGSEGKPSSGNAHADKLIAAWAPNAIA